MSELSKSNPLSPSHAVAYDTSVYHSGNFTMLLRALAATIAKWRQRARERDMLARMGPALGKDLGLSRSDIWRETNKPFWRS